MNENELRKAYFKWLSNIVCGKRYSKDVSYNKLLKHLHNTEFRYLLEFDKGRAKDGEDLRYRFALDKQYDDDWVVDVICEPCTVLEMMVALAIDCEESIMDDYEIGDRTGQWFWGMVVNLGLGAMIDSRYDAYVVDDILDRFMDREYEPDGKGGLFTIKNCKHDLRNVEIWYQTCWYLNTIT